MKEDMKELKQWRSWNIKKWYRFVGKKINQDILRHGGEVNEICKCLKLPKEYVEKVIEIGFDHGKHGVACFGKLV